MIERELAHAGLPPLPRLTWLEVDLSVLVANAHAIDRLLGLGTQLGVVVKADGYGHGIEAAAQAAVAGGARRLFVASSDEALLLRARGVVSPILVLYPVPATSLEECHRAGIDITVTDLESMRSALAHKGVRGAAGRLRVHLAVDTGMTRGGVRPAEAGDYARRLIESRELELAGVWSHLSAPEDKAWVEAQVARFESAVKAISASGFEVPLRHLDATGGVIGGIAPHYDLVRVGLAFYGETPPGLPAPPAVRAVTRDLRSALTLKARAASIQEIDPGTRVGYGGDWSADRTSVVVTLPIGYADGWDRRYSPGGRVLLRGTSLPVVGRVSSDALAVDATAAAPISPTDEFVLLGMDGPDRIGVDELANLRGSISWEVLDSLGVRLPRVYRHEGMIVGARYLDGRTVGPLLAMTQDTVAAVQGARTSC